MQVVDQAVLASRLLRAKQRDRRLVSFREDATRHEPCLFAEKWQWTVPSVHNKVRTGHKLETFNKMGPILSLFEHRTRALFEHVLYLLNILRTFLRAALQVKMLTHVDSSVYLAFSCHFADVVKPGRVEKVGKNGDQAMRMKKVLCLTLPLASQCHNFCSSKRRRDGPENPMPSNL